MTKVFTGPRHATHAAAPARPATGLELADGTLEVLKWVGLLLMALDHINKYLFGERWAALFALGRMVMPLFAFILMFNLARPGALAAGVHVRVMARLAGFGMLASPAFAVLVGWWPLNILFTLFLATLIVWLLEQGGHLRATLAAVSFLFGGAFVEFWWPGLLCCLGAWAWCRRPDALRLAGWGMAIASLFVINRNLSALAVLPLVWGATRVEIPLPRQKWLFYAFYPAHLTALVLAERLA